MMRFLLLSSLLVMSACSDATELTEDVARSRAKAPVSETLAHHFPAIPSPAVPSATECVIDNSDLREVRQFADDAVTGVDKDTVARWLEKASQHVEAVSRYLMVNLHFEAVQLDEFWSFVKKRKHGVPR